ncbi:MAG: sulfate adenylyltransferase subunit CysD [Gammaproteobacteria bacterium]|nr:sulfate adenylyltransferase subunit CysD [Gammaproteobacteria bacterium]
MSNLRVQKVLTLPPEVLANRFTESGEWTHWDTAAVHDLITRDGPKHSQRSTERLIEKSALLPAAVKLHEVADELDRAPIKSVVESLEGEAKRRRWLSLVLQEHRSDTGATLLFCNDGRRGRRWVFIDPSSAEPESLLKALDALADDKPLMIWPHGSITERIRALAGALGSHDIKLPSGRRVRLGTVAYQHVSTIAHVPPTTMRDRQQADRLSHLDRLEADSIHIIREVMAQAENPVMLYSIGKDSSVMLHLARKAFYPSVPPFPLMHIDTRWKFQAMYQFRDQMARDSGMELITYVNPEGVEKNINPFDHGSALHTDIMKTEGLKQALTLHGFDVAFGGARRDEEKSRAKERVFSFRTSTHRWEPKNQRPELWNLYNGYKNKGESIRVFPLSNWTELDVWQYTYREQIPIVPLYFAAERPVIERDGLLILVDDDRLRLFTDERVQIKRVRFRTLGCYPLTGAVESDADDLPSIILELLQSRTSERQGRAIDSDSSSSMEKKKQEGYF